MILLLLVLLPRCPRADSLDASFAHRLARARAGQVERLKSDYEATRVSRLACRLELREARFPITCFRALRREDAWSFRSPDARARLLKRLDISCERATKRLILPPASADLADLSPACRTHVREGWRIRAYREEERETGRDVWSGS